jgi:hypothetical protein
MNPCFAVRRDGEQRGIKNKEDKIMCCHEKSADSKETEMSHDERDKMWEKMMECCCSDMTEEERQKWTHHFHEWGGPMMGMVGKMHGKGGIGHIPWEMCKEMIASIRQGRRIATTATPEVQGLFEDWIEQIEQEMFEYLKDNDSVDIKDLSGHFKISKDSAYYFVTKLAQKGKIKIKIKTDKD